MDVQLTKNSDIPPHQQLAEQIVFLITTGKLRPSERLPSVRALARRLGIHRNTVSKAYQDLVRRGWTRGRPGSRLSVAPAVYLRGRPAHDKLDELIDQSTERARAMGYSLAVLRQRVAARLALQPPDHFLVVEDEPGLRNIIRAEIYSALGKPVEGCSADRFLKSSALAAGAQIVVPEYAFHLLEPVASSDWPPIRLLFCTADTHIKLVQNLKEPSIIAIASVSETLLKTARSVLASAVGRKHSLREVLVGARERPDMSGADVVFCDSLTISRVRCKQKLHYKLISQECMVEIAAILELFAFPNRGLQARSKKRRLHLRAARIPD
jgi:DNA-binding transcriptional regulator YhcF (GntR family)